MRITYLTAFVLLLCGCATNFQYTREGLEPPKAGTEVVVIYDYLSIVDDVGELLDFDEDENREMVEFYGELIKDALNDSGYEISQKWLVSSGLTQGEVLPVDHYVDGKKAEEPGELPVIWNASGFSENEIQIAASLSDELSVNVASLLIRDGLDHGLEEMNFLHYLDSLDISEDALVLVVRISKPRVSFGKAFGAAMIGAVATAGATGGSYVAYPVFYAVVGTYATLVRRDTGELLWKNYYPRVAGKKETQESLFLGLPAAQKAGQ